MVHRILVYQDCRAAAECSSHVLGLAVGACGEHFQQKSLQKSAHIFFAFCLLTRAQILDQRVLEHAVGVRRLQVGEQEAKRTLRHVLQHLLHFLHGKRPLISSMMALRSRRLERAGHTNTPFRFTLIILANARHFWNATHNEPPKCRLRIANVAIWL